MMRDKMRTEPGSTSSPILVRVLLMRFGRDDKRHAGEKWASLCGRGKLRGWGRAEGVTVNE